MRYICLSRIIHRCLGVNEMDNIIDIELTGRSTRRDQKLWQYDYGQVLRIAGKEFPKVTEVQFSLKQSGGHTLDRIGTSNNGLLTVQIPNELLQNKGATSDYTIYAFVYLSGDGFGNTKYMIQLPVESRPEPTDPSEDPSIDPSIFKDAVNAVNASADRAENAANSAKKYAEEAKKYSTGTKEDIAGAVADYMKENPVKVPKKLSEMQDDVEHRTVTDVEKQTWDNKSDFDGNYESLIGKPEFADWVLQAEKPTYTASEVGALPNTTEIPQNLSDLQEDATHRTVTDTEKQSWNRKSDFSGSYNDLEDKPTIPTVPTTLPNPQALTITYGKQTHTYDGSEALAITIETGGIERIEKLSTDTTVTLEPNKLYIFPEMSSLAYTIGEGTGEVHFIFKSGATATRVVHPTNVNIGSFTVDANKIYEVSILEGLLTSQNWSVS